MPIVTWTRAGRIFQCDERGATDHSDVQAAVLGIAVIGATDHKAATVAAASSKASPVLRSGHPRGVSQRLVRATSKGDDIVLMKDDVRLPSFDARELSTRRRLAAQNIDRTRQLGEFDFKRARLSLQLIAEFRSFNCQHLAEGTVQGFAL